MNILSAWLVSALSFLMVAFVVPGIHIDSLWTALVIALLWGIIGVTLRPILLILTLPVTLITLGLFTFVINAFFLLLLSSIVKGFFVDGFLVALFGALALSGVHWALHLVFRKTALED